MFVELSSFLNILKDFAFNLNYLLQHTRSHTQENKHCEYKEINFERNPAGK